jgi:signal peptidase II
MSRIARYRLIGLVLAAAIFVVDQIIKRSIIRDFGLDQVGESIQILPFFDLTRVNNYGVSLGLFSATSMEARWMLVALTGAIALFVLVWMLREKAFGDIIALSMILGGALGNIRDRATRGFVIDYADLHIGDFRPFMIFNVADAAITIGVVIILARTLLSREKPQAPADTPASES